jgi:hypothetical protein
MRIFASSNLKIVKEIAKDESVISSLVLYFELGGR